MTEEGLTLRDLKKQERLEKRGGVIARLPQHFHERAAKLRRQLQEALEACDPTQTGRSLDLHEDLQKLEGLLREITVTRERKLLLAAHEAVSGLSPDVKNMEERERPLFSDLKQVLASHRQRVFTGPGAAPVKAVPPSGGGLHERSPALPAVDMAAEEAIEEAPSVPEVEPEISPLAPESSPDPGGLARGPGKVKRSSPDSEPPLNGEPRSEPEARQEPQPQLQPPSQSRSRDEPEAGTPVTRDLPPDPGTYQVVRVLENLQPFTGIDARVYSLKAQDVVSLPAFNARRLTEVGIVVPVGRTGDRPAPSGDQLPEGERTAPEPASSPSEG